MIDYIIVLAQQYPQEFKETKIWVSRSFNACKNNFHNFVYRFENKSESESIKTDEYTVGVWKQKGKQKK